MVLQGATYTQMLTSLFRFDDLLFFPLLILIKVLSYSGYSIIMHLENVLLALQVSRSIDTFKFKTGKPFMRHPVLAKSKCKL